MKHNCNILEMDEHRTKRTAISDPKVIVEHMCGGPLTCSVQGHLWAFQCTCNFSATMTSKRTPPATQPNLST